MYYVIFLDDDFENLVVATDDFKTHAQAKAYAVRVGEAYEPKVLMDAPDPN